MKASNPSISIVILSYNAKNDLKKLLNSIELQTIQPEIIIIDSESTDGTQDYLKDSGFPFTSIQKSAFNHGRTRNLGLELANSEIVAFVTQDVILENPLSLEKLIGPFKTDSEVAMTFGRQLPKSDATILSEFARLHNYPNQSIIKSKDDIIKYGIKTCFISNSFSAYRKTVLEKMGGFPRDLIMCEDVYIGAKAILKGHKIAYVAEARAIHSHNYSVSQEFTRYFDIGYFYNSEPWILQNFKAAESEGLSFIRKEILFIFKKKSYLLLPEFFIRTLLKYLGYKLGKYPTYLPKNIKRKLSMHSYYWDSKH